MARRFPRDHRQFDADEVATPAVMRTVLYLVAAAAVIGFLAGLVWTVWHLLRLHVFR